MWYIKKTDDDEGLCFVYSWVCLLFPVLAHGIYVLSADTLIEEALHAYQNGEKVG